MNKLDSFYIGVRVRLEKAGERIKDFLASQDGVSNVVATIIILLIVVLLIAAFWKQLSGWISGIMAQIFDESKLPKESDLGGG